MAIEARGLRVAEGEAALAVLRADQAAAARWAGVADLVGAAPDPAAADLAADHREVAGGADRRLAVAARWEGAASGVVRHPALAAAMAKARGAVRAWAGPDAADLRATEWEALHAIAWAARDAADLHVTEWAAPHAIAWADLVAEALRVTAWAARDAADLRAIAQATVRACREAIRGARCSMRAPTACRRCADHGPERRSARPGSASLRFAPSSSASCGH